MVKNNILNYIVLQTILIDAILMQQNKTRIVISGNDRHLMKSPVLGKLRIIRQINNFSRRRPWLTPSSGERQSDIIYFRDEDDNSIFIPDSRKTSSSVAGMESSTIVAIPGMGTTRSACEDRCQTTPEYNPVCGDNGISYFSFSRLKCAQSCGIRVKEKYRGACSKTG